MSFYVIKGGEKLKGVVKIGGAKNATLPLMAASLLSAGDCVLVGIPFLHDVLMLQDILGFLGVKVKWEKGALLCNGREVAPREVGPALMRPLRASNLVMGPLLARFRRVKAAYPGGCEIGSRPMDLHFKGFQALGAQVKEGFGEVEIKAEQLKGSEVYLDFPSVGATENIILAATLAEGVTTVRNAAREPEIVDLQNFLNLMGARVRGAGTDTVRIEGVKHLRGAEYTVMPDRIEAGTHLLAGTVTQGNVTVTNVIPEHLTALAAKLKEMGAEVITYQDALEVRTKGPLQAINCRTLPYPGFPTDLQPQLTTCMALARGVSTVTEGLFEKRFRHAEELRQMGAKIKVEGRTAFIEGAEKLTGTVVEAGDLRAGAALFLAGLAAEGTTVLENVIHLDRGYEDLEVKYRALGARLQRVEKEGVKGGEAS